MVLVGLLAVALGCGGDLAASAQVSAPPSQDAAPMAVPTLPADCWIQVALLDSAVVYRLTEQGQLRVTLPGQAERDQQPLSKHEPGIQRVSEQGRTRLGEAVAAVGFFDLPATIEGGPLSGTLVNNEQPSPQPVAFSVRAEDGRVHAVQVLGDPASPASLGRLGPLWTALDLEALGGWLGE